MAYVSYVPPKEASKKLADLYRRYQEPWGGMDNIIRVHSHNPSAMESHYKLYAIHDICSLVAYYAYANRIADGLGVELEAYWETDESGAG